MSFVAFRGGISAPRTLIASLRLRLGIYKRGTRLTRSAGLGDVPRPAVLRAAGKTAGPESHQPRATNSRDLVRYSLTAAASRAARNNASRVPSSSISPQQHPDFLHRLFQIIEILRKAIASRRDSRGREI